MNSLIKLIINYQKTNSNETFKEIVKSFEGLIKHKIKTIPAYYKDDIYQEMLMELFNCIKQFKINLTANIDQTLFNIEIYNCLKNNDFKNVNSKLQNKYIRLFIKKYGTKLLEKAFTCKYHQDLFVKEFCYFTNQNQFIKNLNKRFLFVYLNFLKKHQKDLNKMAVKFGIVNGQIMNNAQVEELAKIPSKEVLIAMLLGTLNAPVSALARALNAIAEKQN